MAGHVLAIHVLLLRKEGVDARHKAGHDGVALSATGSCIPIASMRHAEVGGDNVLVALDVVGGGVGDLAAVIEHDHALG